MMIYYVYQVPRSGEIDETVAKSLLFILEYIYLLLCVGEELACLRTMAEKFSLTQN